MAAFEYQMPRATTSSNTVRSGSRRPMPTLPDDRESWTSGTKGGQKELPILLMLDVSPSMRDNDRIGQQNTAVHKFLAALCQNSKVRNAARVAFCLFTKKIVYRTGFMKLNELTFQPGAYLEKTLLSEVKYAEEGKVKTFLVNFPVFKAAEKDGTNIPLAVSEAVEIMQEYTRGLAGRKVQKYVPFLLFTSDGNPDLTQNPDYTAEIQSYYMDQTREAADSINRVCNREKNINELIVPFFIGIGDAQKSYLERYSKNFPMGVIMVDNRLDNLTFSSIFSHIAEAIAQSLVMQNTSGALLNTLTKKIENIYDA